MKTKLAGLLALCMVLTMAFSVSAAELTDMYDGTIEISGTAKPNQKRIFWFLRRTLRRRRQ